MKLKAIIVSMLSIVLSCSLLPKPGSTVDYLPRETDVPGWEIAGKYRTSNVKKIVQVAPHSSEYDPVELVAAEYNYLSDKTRIIRVRLFKFRVALDAFGLYSRERGFIPGAQFIDDDTYLSGRSLFSRLGRFYITVSGEPEGAPDTASLQLFMAVIRQNLKSQAGDDTLPDYILSLSEQGSRRDVVYLKGGVEAIPGAKELFMVRRTISGKSYNLVYSRLQTAFDAEQAFQKILKAGSGAFMLTKIGNLQPAIRILGSKEYVFVTYYKQWIFGVLNAETMNDGTRVIFIQYGDMKEKSGRRVTSEPDK